MKPLLKTAAEFALIGAIFLALVLIVRALPAAEPQHVDDRVWVIRIDEPNKQRDVNRDAVSRWFMDRAQCGTSWSSSTNTITIRLDDREGATSRKDLLGLAREARANLPPGCPMMIRVETIAEAVAYKQARVAELIEEMNRLNGMVDGDDK